MFMSIIFEVLTSISYWENLCLFILKISAALTSVTHGCLGWINLLAPCVQTVPSYLPKSFSNGAINLTNYWGSFSLLGVLCGAVIIWRCCFRAVLRKESSGGKWLRDWLSTDIVRLADFSTDLPNYLLTIWWTDRPTLWLRNWRLSKRPKKVCLIDLVLDWPSDWIADWVINWFVSLEAGHIHEESPAVPICLKFLLRKCSEGTECPEHHCFLPYHGQYNVSSGVEWKSFSEKDNLALEKLYCDVNVEGPVKLNLAQAIAR